MLLFFEMKNYRKLIFVGPIINNIHLRYPNRSYPTINVIVFPPEIKLVSKNEKKLNINLFAS